MLCVRSRISAGRIWRPRWAAFSAALSAFWGLVGHYFICCEAQQPPHSYLGTTLQQAWLGFAWAYTGLLLWMGLMNGWWLQLIKCCFKLLCTPIRAPQLREGHLPGILCEHHCNVCGRCSKTCLLLCSASGEFQGGAPPSQNPSRCLHFSCSDLQQASDAGRWR